MIIRFAETHDFDGIMSLLRELNPEDPVITDGRDRAVFDAIMRNPDLRLIVAVENDKVVATCYLNIIPNLTRNAAPYAVIENVVTTTALRNRGIGSAIIRFALEYAWKAGCYKATRPAPKRKAHIISTAPAVLRRMRRRRIWQGRDNSSYQLSAVSFCR